MTISISKERLEKLLFDTLGELGTNTKIGDITLLQLERISQDLAKKIETAVAIEDEPPF
jgi:hypothetical protein